MGQFRYAERTECMESSILREILKVTAQPGMISLAGGLPSPDAFPVELVKELCDKALTTWKDSILQYGTSEGFAPLLEALSDYLKNDRHIKSAETDRILVTNGSQQILDVVAKLFIMPGDKIAVESPTYLGALQAFNPYQPVYVDIATDEEGVIPESLEEVAVKEKPKFFYLVPTFQNPTGKSIGLERRKAIADIAIKHNLLIVEDDPYGAIRYRGEPLPPIASLASDNILYSGTFSKTFAPGLRLGFVTAPKDLISWMVKAKQSIDLHTSTFVQALAALYLGEGHMKRQIPKICELYRPKQEAMLVALKKHFPSSFFFTEPEGGMFVWAEGPEGFDSLAVYEKAIERKVAYVPGRFFYTRKEDGAGTMRLNFTNSTVEQINSAIATLGELFAEHL
ncbi:aminotransferase-like domain-containing protein [Sediminispirochaeta smaragdinae]|uniref:Transcriptional regulator, GntR family n=1 Tax=Sediminispirochaeta smaragdinae (strain DSM 11293 / JCM 15392 / SEBR 4228) TaxID=573413 RepID=E1R928_SEDSS|nr:PLP-dependent aminotransferase family protein [Sediminispirochaeta smaragdinae]ADK82997.1 putative transcriptional regulator, GntR family [Sediminispirochaeta smaragdinae DSM 11293]